MPQSSTETIVRELEGWISQAGVGTKLPTSRELMDKHSVSPVTVRNAIHILRERGLVEVRPGVGVFTTPPRTTRVADFKWQAGALGAFKTNLPIITPAQRTASPDVIALNNGYPDESLLPVTQVRRALSRVGKETTAFKRSPVRGLPQLQEWFAQKLDCSPRNVLIVTGTQSGLSAIIRSVIGEGRPMIVESPTYWGAILAAKEASVVLHPISSDDSGPRVAELELMLKTTGARVFYAQPHFTNPHGRSWSEERRTEILDVVRKYGAFLIEDDWAHDFWFDHAPAPLTRQDPDGHVIYLRSLTKTVSPAIRVGAVVAKGPVLNRITSHAAAEAMYTSSILQQVALEVVSSSAWDRHLNTVRKQLKQRRDDLLLALDTYAPDIRVDHVPAGGLNLWCDIEPGIDVEAFSRQCEINGLLISPGQGWFPTDPTGSFFRLNFAGTGSEAFNEAARILQQSLTELPN